MSFMGSSLASGGKGALLTALAYSAVRSHQAVRAAGSPLPKQSGRRGPSPVCQVYRSNRSNAKRRLCAECVEVEFSEVGYLVRAIA